MRDREQEGNGFVDLSQELGEENVLIGFSQPSEPFEFDGATECGTPILKLSPPEDNSTVAKQAPSLPMIPPSPADGNAPAGLSLQQQVITYNEKPSAEVEDLYDSDKLDDQKPAAKQEQKDATVYYNNCTFNITNNTKG